MKKWVFMLIMIFAMFGFAGCAGATTTDGLTINSVSIPTNLAINGTTLTWDAVDNANGYIVYVNDVEQTTLTTNSYNFSSLTENVLIFRVKAKGPVGVTDSELSVSIAYMVNKTQEIASLNTWLEEEMFADSSVPTGFADELANKGMTTAGLQAIVTAFQTFQTAGEAAEGDMLLTNTALKTFLATDMNLEALLSAAIVTVVPQTLHESISSLEDEIAYIGSHTAYYDDYEAEIAMYQSNIDMLESILDMLDESGEETLLALMQTVDALIAFQEDIDNAFLTLINNQVTNDSLTLGTMNTSEILIIKDEAVAILRENVPSMEHMVLLGEVIVGLQNAIYSATDPAAVTTDYSIQLATESILMMNLFIEMFDNYDLAYLNEIKSLYLEFYEDTPAMFGAELVILNLQYMDNFLSENQTEIDQINAVFTDAQKEEIYNSSMAMIPSNYLGMFGMNYIMAVMSYGMTSIDYQTISAVSDIFDESANILLDSLVATDGEIIRKIVIMSGFVDSYYSSYFSNDILGETYATYEEYLFAETQAAMELVQQILIHFSAIVDNLTAADMQAIVDLIMVAIPFEEMFVSNTSLTETQTTTLLTNIENLLTAQMPNLLEFGQNLLSYIDDEEMMTNLLTEYSTWEPLFDTEDNAYALTIFFSEYYNGFMNATNKQAFLEISGAIFNFFRTPEFLTLSDSDTAIITNIETGIGDALDFSITETGVFKAYDPFALTSARRERIEISLTT